MKNYNQLVEELNKVQFEVHSKYDTLLAGIDNIRAEAYKLEQERKANEYDYQFTKADMIKLVQLLQVQIIEQVIEGIQDNFEIDSDVASISWHTDGNVAEAEIEIDNSEILKYLTSGIQDMMWDDNDKMAAEITLTETINELKNN